MGKIIHCPDCQRQLQIDEQTVGAIVQCPKCRHRFAASAITENVPTPAAMPPRPDSFANATIRRWEAEEEEDYDIRRERRPSAADDFDDDDWPEVGRRTMQPHRATMILAFAVLSCVAAPLIFGSLAFFMGRADLRAMDEGRMDPSGRPMTQTGTILGIVMAILHVLALIVMIAYLYSIGAFLPG